VVVVIVLESTVSLEYVPVPWLGFRFKNKIIHDILCDGAGVAQSV
jgi:hypothetical protein